MTIEKEEESEVIPQSFKDELKKEGKKFLWIAIGIILLVVLNVCISIATLVLVVSRPAPGQFPNTPNLQRFRN